MQDVRTAWKKHIENYYTDASSHLHLCLLKAIKAKTNDKFKVLLTLAYRAFTPASVDNAGCSRGPWDGLTEAIHYLTMHGQRSVLYSVLETPEEQDLWTALLQRLSKEKFRDPVYTCIFVRTDISPEQQIVQAAHVATVVGHEYIVDCRSLHIKLYGCDSGKSLADTRWFLAKNHIHVSIFIDGVRGNREVTALATAPSRMSARRMRWVSEVGLSKLTYDAAGG